MADVHHVIDLEKSNEDLAAELTAALVQAAGLSMGLGARGKLDLSYIRLEFLRNARDIFNACAEQITSGNAGVANDG